MSRMVGCGPENRDTAVRTVASSASSAIGLRMQFRQQVGALAR
jgi:hypothetical protein